MDYVSAILPPLVMAAGFAFLVVTIIKNQGGANRAKEDAAVDAVLARTGTGEGAAPAAAETGS